MAMFFGGGVASRVVGGQFEPQPAYGQVEYGHPQVIPQGTYHGEPYVFGVGQTGVGGSAKYAMMQDDRFKPKSEMYRACCCACQTCCLFLVLLLGGFAIVLYLRLNEFQAWSVQHASHPLARLWQPWLSTIESYWAMNPLYLDGQRVKYGNVFMVAGQVCMGDFDTVEKTLTTPQARSTLLGASQLIEWRLPHRNDGSLSFLLALSDQAAGGRGLHEAYKSAIVKAFFNHDAAARQDDAISDQLIKELAFEYKGHMQQDTLAKFFEDAEIGWQRFIIRYLHYVLLGLNPNDSEATALFIKAYYTVGGAVYYLPGLGLTPMAHAGQVGDLQKEVAARYQMSPAAQAAAEVWGAPEHMGLQLDEAARLMVSVMTIAGMQGPMVLGLRALGHMKLPDYKGAHIESLTPPSAIDITMHWDALDLNDDEAIELYVLETARLYSPVSATARVAQEPFTVWVAGYDREYPAGTLVNVPISMASLDANKWGTTRYDFNPQRKGLKEFTMAFNMVGDRDGGRACPGRDISLQMLVEVLREIGQVRRQTRF